MLYNPFLLLVLVVHLPMQGMAYLRQKHARLILDDCSLQYRCGIPFLEKRLNWRLDLNAIRTQEVAFHVVRPQSSIQSLQGYMVRWGDGSAFDARVLQPAGWYLPDQPDGSRARLAGSSFFLLRPTPRHLAELQARLDALPLVHALAQRGVQLPPVTAKPASLGLDLFAFARMKAAVYLFFSLLASAAVLLALVRHSYYFVSPPLSLWLAFGGLSVACTLAWLWRESLADEAGHSQSARLTLQPGFRATQTVLACLVGLAAGLCAPSVPLLFGNLMQAPQAQEFVLHKLPLELVAVDQAIPAIHMLDQAEEYWQSLPQGERVTLPIRSGPGGLWWQYDATAVREKWIAYYDAHP